MIVSEVGRMIERLLQLLAAAVGHHRHLRRKPLHVLRLPREEALRDEQREVGVLVAGVLEHLVQGPLHLLPDGIPVGPDDHAATDRAVIGELRPGDDLIVPGAEVSRRGWSVPCSQPWIRALMIGRRGFSGTDLLSAASEVLDHDLTAGTLVGAHHHGEPGVTRVGQLELLPDGLGARARIPL